MGFRRFEDARFDLSPRQAVILDLLRRRGRAMLELTGIGWSAGRETPVTGVDLALAPGSAAAFLNLSQEQRHTLLEVLAGRRRLDAGRGRLSGRALAEAGRRRGALVVVGPKGAKPSGRTVRSELEAAGRVGAGGLLDQMNLSQAAGRRVRDTDLSERVRLALACAVARKPGLIVLDRSFEGLTPRDTQAAAEALKLTLEARPVPVLLLGEARAAAVLGAYLVVFERGQVVQSGDSVELALRPLRLAVALATASPRLNTLGVAMEEGVGRLADGSRFTPPPGLDLPAQGRCTLAFRPDDMARERGDAGALRFAAREEGDDPCGYARIGFGGETWLTPASDAPRPGRILNAFVPRDRVMLFDAEGWALRRP